jgi:uncharacterized membrane protein YfcA
VGRKAQEKVEFHRWFGSNRLGSIRGCKAKLRVGHASTAASAAYLEQGIDFGLVVILGIGSVVGAYAGARLTQRIDRKLLTAALGLLTLGFALFMIFNP